MTGGNMAKKTSLISDSEGIEWLQQQAKEGRIRIFFDECDSSERPIKDFVYEERTGHIYMGFDLFTTANGFLHFGDEDCVKEPSTKFSLTLKIDLTEEK